MAFGSALIILAEITCTTRLSVQEVFFPALMMKTCSIFSPSFLLITSFSLSSLSPSKLLHQGSALCSSRMTFGNEKAGSWMTWKSFVPLSWEHKQRGHTGTAATLPSCAFLSAEILRCHCTSRPVIQTAGNLYFFRYLLNFLDFI